MAFENSGSRSQSSKPATPANNAATAARETSAALSGAGTAPVTEKRRSPRYKCEGSAEIRRENRDSQTWATFTDISLHGCYVEATATYDTGTPLRIKLSANGYEVNTKGAVRVSYPSLGMGIAFTEMSDADRARLKELLQTISRPSVIVGHRVTSSASAALGPQAIPQIFDPAAAIQAIIKFFESRQMLMRDDFLRLLRSSQKSDDAPGF